jgi:polyhydroxyalkanoate depolymerase
MLYETYQFQDDVMAPIRGAARAFKDAGSRWPVANGWPAGDDLRRRFAAGFEMISRFRLTHTRPEFGIASVLSGNRRVAVSEQVVLDLPFGRLLRFKKDADARQPKVLIVAPLSGHFATLLAKTVETMLRDHDVYITDWANARDVPLAAGDFGIEDYVDYVIRFVEAMGPDTHLFAVCQPCVQALVAAAVMGEAKHPDTPRSMILMAGPVDPRESPTEVNKLATDKPLDWFRSNVIARVPGRYAGGGRKVYPGFVQLMAFMAMNMERHRSTHQKLYEHLAKGETAEAQKIKDFYDEYFAVLDLTQEFYLETIDRVFQKADLATGSYTHHGRKVDPGKVTRTALMTVEGGRDDICALGQTAAAHDLCRSLRPHMRRHHLQANVGHYGTFSGRRWENEIYPVVRNFIMAME